VIAWADKVVIPMQFGIASDFKEGLAQACVGMCDYTQGSGYNGKFGFIDRSGHFVINPIYDNAGDSKNGFASVTERFALATVDSSRCGRLCTLADFAVLVLISACSYLHSRSISAP
jgi:hypothetical protein